MKKPARRNADKALCAYFTSRDRARQVGKPQGTWVGLQLGGGMKQLTLNLTLTPAPPVKSIFKNTTWLSAGWATACIGFTKKVEISQSLSDALKPHYADDEDDHDQQLYDALWMAHHYLALDQRPSFSFTFDFLQDDEYNGRLIETSLRLHVEDKEQVILLGLSRDF